MVKVVHKVYDLSCPPSILSEQKEMFHPDEKKTF